MRLDAEHGESETERHKLEADLLELQGLKDAADAQVLVLRRKHAALEGHYAEVEGKVHQLLERNLQLQATAQELREENDRLFSEQSGLQALASEYQSEKSKMTVLRWEHTQLLNDNVKLREQLSAALSEAVSTDEARVQENDGLHMLVEDLSASLSHRDRLWQAKLTQLAEKQLEDRQPVYQPRRSILSRQRSRTDSEMAIALAESRHRSETEAALQFQALKLELSSTLAQLQRAKAAHKKDRKELLTLREVHNIIGKSSPTQPELAETQEETDVAPTVDLVDTKESKIASTAVDLNVLDSLNEFSPRESTQTFQPQPLIIADLQLATVTEENTDVAEGADPRDDGDVISLSISESVASQKSLPKNGVQNVGNDEEDEVREMMAVRIQSVARGRLARNYLKSKANKLVVVSAVPLADMPPKRQYSSGGRQGRTREGGSSKGTEQARNAHKQAESNSKNRSEGWPNLTKPSRSAVPTTVPRQQTPVQTTQLGPSQQRRQAIRRSSGTKPPPLSATAPSVSMRSLVGK